jgi:hypothetical protein
MIPDFDPHDPKSMFNTIISDSFQFDLCNRIHAQYGLAAEHCFDTFLEAEAKDILPYYRRASIESALVDCLEKHRVKVNAEKNIIGNCSHRLIVSDRILLTQSCVRFREELPRDAFFRLGYARSGQGYLFDDDRPPDPNSYLYAIITHCPSGSIKTPAFIDIIFPDENYEKIIGRIRLLDKFPQIGQVEFEEIKDSLQLKEASLRLKGKKKA